MSTNNNANDDKTPPSNPGTARGYKVGDKVVARKPTTAKRPFPTSGSSLLFSKEELAALEDSDDEIPSIADNEVQFEKTEKKEDPIATATMEDVKFTLQSINPLKRINEKKPRHD